MLYDPSAHEPLAHIPWDENLAREATRESWFGLWTGDLGTALYAWQCIQGDPALPTLTGW
jgi:hypothetical protein